MCVCTYARSKLKLRFAVAACVRHCCNTHTDTRTHMQRHTLTSHNYALVLLRAKSTQSSVWESQRALALALLSKGHVRCEWPPLTHICASAKTKTKKTEEQKRKKKSKEINEQEEAAAAAAKLRQRRRRLWLRHRQRRRRRRRLRYTRKRNEQQQQKLKSKTSKRSVSCLSGSAAAECPVVHVID